MGTGGGERGQITALLPDVRHPESVRILLDGRVHCTVPREVVVAERLSVGMWLEGAVLERVGRTADIAAAYRTALQSLERRPFARQDLARRLIQRGHLPEIVAEAIERVAGAGFLDDERFGQHYVETRIARGRGPLRIRRELMQQGVEQRIVDRALAQVVERGADPAEQAMTLGRRRAHQLRDLAPEVRRRRLHAYLTRRGFPQADIRHVLAAVLGARA